MTEPDYKIEELFDFDKMLLYYRVLRLSLTGMREYVLEKNCDNLEQAEYYIRMRRKYRKPIYHYVED